MFWNKGNFWNFVLRTMARSQGFLDPVTVMANLQRFSKPSEVWVPTELLRSGAILQARGLMNSQAIQHNMDWVWPYWVERQFDPSDEAFIPRAFNVTHINLTHRNWTAVGVPDCDEFPLVDPRGLVTPVYDGWSIDAWVIHESKKNLLPSRSRDTEQHMEYERSLAIETNVRMIGAALFSRAEVVHEDGKAVCRVRFEAVSESKAWLVLSVRPFNPEGISFVRQIKLHTDNNPGWLINNEQKLYLSSAPTRYVFSNYSVGDVYDRLFARDARPDDDHAKCEVGMASAAALYELKPGEKRLIEARVPLVIKPSKHAVFAENWEESLDGTCRLEIPDKNFKFLYDSGLRTMVLHSPGDVYPGPYTYKRFWFRDAAFILHAMMCVGLRRRAERVLDTFPSRQTATGHFLSQDGEWDSNGQALWALERFCRLNDRMPKEEWASAIKRGGEWIRRKRVKKKDSLYLGLMPAGFSAEHLGPNDYYYWDDFWSVAGLNSAAWMLRKLGDHKAAESFTNEASDLLHCIEENLVGVRKRLGHDAMPAAPDRRMDAGAIGSVAAGYPLQLWPGTDPKLKATADFLLKKCFFKGGFYQEISHSGVNAYLTVHVAQLLLRAGDPRYFDLLEVIASMASPTGQWPEAIHPHTGGGCMGDGQHVWAVAEWVMAIRNMFVREEEETGTMVLCQGIPQAWIDSKEKMRFGPSFTSFGKISVQCESDGEKTRVSWQAEWHGKIPAMEVRLPGHPLIIVDPNIGFVEVPNKAREAAVA